MKKFLAVSLSDVNIMLKSVNMPTIVGILTFTSRIYFMLSQVEHEKSFINSGPYLFHDYLRRLQEDEKSCQSRRIIALIDLFVTEVIKVSNILRGSFVLNLSG